MGRDRKKLKDVFSRAALYKHFEQVAQIFRGMSQSHVLWPHSPTPTPHPHPVFSPCSLFAISMMYVSGTWTIWVYFENVGEKRYSIGSNICFGEFGVCDTSTPHITFQNLSHIEQPAGKKILPTMGLCSTASIPYFLP